MSGWKVRKSVDRDDWTLLGKQNPQKPQMFNTIVSGDGEDMGVKMGDVIAARCTMVNHLDHDVRIGPTNNDEMCNFYLMYWVAGQKPMAIEQGWMSSTVKVAYLFRNQIWTRIHQI